MLNLINDRWIPVTCQSGVRKRIAPWQLTETEDPIIALDAPRPDFNGALLQFLIGLLQTAATPRDENSWIDWLEQPPSPQNLKQQFEPFVDAFEANHSKGSFMQDFEPLEVGLCSIGELLIDAPSGKTIRDNTDHFVKRGEVQQLCPGCAVTALFCLQTNAPSGGVGHRTSLRGGGPMTTLVVIDDKQVAGIDDAYALPNDLWRNLWINVLDQTDVDGLTGSPHKPAKSDVFPWLAQTRTSEKTSGVETTPLDAHPFQMYWGMPRRIRIHWDSSHPGTCDLCQAVSNHLLSSYQTKNYGVNYTGSWEHPLSPHSINKAGELLPRHPQPGGISYRHWLGLIEQTETRYCAKVVARYRGQAEKWNEQLRLFAFGYDMDNMKARCWYQTTFPVFSIAEEIRLNYAKGIHNLTLAASSVANSVQSCVKSAWFKRPGEIRGDSSFIKQRFFQQTDQAFFQAAERLPEALSKGDTDEILHGWHQTLRTAAFALFDYWAVNGDFSQQNPRRIAEARAKLERFLYSKAIKQALRLPNRRNKEAA